MPLTELAVRQAKPKTKDYKLSDEKGLFLLVKVNGARYWRLKYRHPVSKKERVLAIGVYPEISLKQARAKREEARNLLAEGIDPSEYKQQERVYQESEVLNSFEPLANEWFIKQQNTWAPATSKKNRAMLDNELIPFLGNRAIDDLSTWDLLQALNRIVSRGTIETAHRCRQILNQICRYAMQTGRASANPAADLVGALPARNTVNRAAIVEPRRFAKLLLDIDSYKGTMIIRTLLALAPLLFQRPGELASMEWSELDLDEGFWHIPKAKKKERNKREGDHTVPLATQSIALLQEIQPLTGRYAHVFPNQRDYSKHANPESVNKALREMGYSTKTDQCFHGFRASARTMLDEQLGLRVEWIEHQLAHAVRDPLGRAYNRTKHLPERVVMMQRWADYLDELKRGLLAGVEFSR